MTGYSENREHNLEIKYLRKVLGGVDDGIILPESLKAENLVEKLAGVQQNAPAMSEALLRPRSFFSMRSGLAYAAAFLLIVGLFYALDFNKQDNLIGGAIALEPGQSRAAALDNPNTPVEEAVLLGEPASDTPASSGDAEPNIAELAPFTAAIAPIPENDAPGGSDAVGGIVSTRIGEFGDYLLAYRPAEPTDPEKLAVGELEILSAEENSLISRVELPFMTQVLHTFAGANTLAVVGQDAENVYVLSLDLSELEAPKPIELLSQPGRLSAARDFEGTVHVISYSADAQAAENAVTLPDSAETGVAILTALSLDDGASNRMSFSGAGDEIKLFGVNAYLYYDGITVENGEEKSDFFIAQVKLSGLDIELGGIS